MHDLGVADGDDLPGDDAHALHEAAVDEEPVRRVEVDELDALVDLDARVPLGDERVGEHDVDADGSRPIGAVAAAQRELAPGLGAAAHAHDRGRGAVAAGGARGRVRDDRRR